MKSHRIVAYSVLAGNVGQSTHGPGSKVTLDPRKEKERQSDQSQVSHSVSVANDGQKPEISTTPEFGYHCSNIPTAMSQGNAQALVDELMLILQSSDFNAKMS